MATSYVIAMSGASDATTEQYFSSDRSTACRTLASSAPSPRTATWNAIAVYRRGGVSRRVPCRETSSVSSLTRCFCKMMTTSDAVHVAAASSSSSTGDVAAAESPSTRIGGRPVPLPSNCSARSHRIDTSAVFAISVAPAGRQSDVQPVPTHPVHAVVLEQPVERGVVMQLESEHGVEPQPGACRIGAAAIAARHAEAQPDVGSRHLFVVGEAPQRLEIADVAVRAVEDADLCRGA